MKWLTEKILKNKAIVLIIFLLALIFSVFSSKLVKVNYDLADYLPEDSHSTVSLEVMNKEFEKGPPNLRVMLEEMSIPKVLEYKDRISKVDGVKEIQWLDDSVNINQPIEMIDKKVLDSWYKDKNALFSIVVDDGNGLQDTINDIKGIVGSKGAIEGQAATSAFAQASTGEESSKIMMFLIPLILIILIISTSSYFEPFLFLLTVGVAILINTGTNIFLGEISFITQSTTAILQLAVSMDYSIFLLHKFAKFRGKGMDVKEAMANAMEKSFSPIVASASTTIFGFLSLTLMRFKIGPDLGIVLAKGIIISLLSVMFLFPVLAIYTYKIIDKTQHKSFLPSFEKFSKFSMKIGPIAVVIICLLTGPAFLAKDKNQFSYGASSMSSGEETEIGKDTAKINKLYGKSNQVVLMIPSDDEVAEKEITDKLYNIECVSDVISYSEAIGNEIPRDFIPKDKVSSLVSDNYSRMIITLAAEEESDTAFKTVESIRNLSKEYFADDYYLAGGSPSTYDIKTTVTTDDKVTTIGAIVAIGLVILITFKSASIPIILLIAIESSIWINLSVSYFKGIELAFIGYMVISSVQLGATVDYAILFADEYLQNRKKYLKENAVIKTIKSTTGTVLTSGIILSVSGYTLGLISSNTVIAQLGTLIGRGAILSILSVLLFLPTIMVMFDKVIEKTSKNIKFYKEGDKYEDKHEIEFS
ncbi:efflux RND transporter permease subunit [Romboutsia sp.]|uniref:efflux RND transporter permease subunit n=1 Tax=Romboutsia sp. TaxID=1965302 RepID=UPI003F3744E3